MAKNILLNRAGAITQPSYTKLVTGNGSISLKTCMYCIRKLPHYGYEPGWSAKLCHNFPKPITTDCVKCFGEVDKGHVGFHILFLTFLLKLSCCEDHVYCSPVFPESTLAFWYKSSLKKTHIQAVQWEFVSMFPAIDKREMHL